LGLAARTVVPILLLARRSIDENASLLREVAGVDWQESGRAVAESSRGVHIELEYVVHTLPRLQRGRCACFVGLDRFTSQLGRVPINERDLRQHMSGVVHKADYWHVFSHVAL